MPSLNSWYWHFLEDCVYRMPSPSPRKRTKPMDVICVGLPRSGTESLQHALLRLGYDYTYHGWDILFEQPYYAQEWSKLARKKFFPDAGGDGDCNISAEEFGKLLGHSVAVTDAVSSVFAAEMISAYPDAKVVLNVRRDPDAWHASAVENLVGVNENRLFWFMSWWKREGFWAWHVYERLMWAGLFRCMDGTLDSGIRRNGKWVYREHCAMVRGLMPKEGLLEWSVEDGWEPLCDFLGEETPKEDFPRTNDAAGFKGREKQLMQIWFGGVFWNIGKAAALVGLTATLIWSWRRRTLLP